MLHLGKTAQASLAILLSICTIFANGFRKGMLKNIRCSYTLYKKKFVALQFKAINSENDQKIGRNYNGNIAGNF